MPPKRPNRANRAAPELEAFWTRVDATIRAAKGGGHLLPIETQTELVVDAGVCFVVRAISSLRRKDSAATRLPADFNPFLPPEPALLIADVAPQHRAVLNKFPVLDRHVLIVTADFEEQRNALTVADFEALLRVLPPGGLGFYNAGRVAGASQRHKHLQVVPLPLARELAGVTPSVPIEAAMTSRHRRVGDLGLPFRHAGLWLDEPGDDGLSDRAARLEAAYAESIRQLGLNLGLNDIGDVAECGRLPPYNLLVTNRWMVVIPRCADRFEGLSVNALGYAGALLVRSAEQIEYVRASGPMRILRELALAPG